MHGMPKGSSCLCLCPRPEALMLQSRTCANYSLCSTGTRTAERALLCSYSNQKSKNTFAKLANAAGIHIHR